MERVEVKDLKEVAILMDSKYELPGGFRVGWDGILGFFPGLGDLLTNGVSFYIVLRAALLGVPASVILRMGINILIDNLLDAIPILGNFLDFAWKSNIKNVVLLENYLENPRHTVTSSRAVVWVVLAVLLAAIAATIAGTIYAALWLSRVAFGGFL
jgi:hypothetical protein